METNLDGFFHLYRQFATSEGKSPRTIECNIADVRSFDWFLGGCQDIRHVTAEDLRRYIIYLQNRPRYATHPTIKSRDRNLSPDAIASYVRGIRSFWSWLKSENFIQDNPFVHVKPPKVPAKVVEPLFPDEVGCLLKAIPREGKYNQRDRCIILTLYGIGPRVSEVFSLKLDNVNFSSSQITVTGKGAKQRALFMSPVLFKALFRYRHNVRPDVESDFFFVDDVGRPVDRYYIEHKIASCALQANIGRRVTPHLLRYSFAIQFLRNGGDPFTLQNILGHSTLDMTRHYVRIANTDVERSIKKFSPAEQLGKFI